MLYLLSIFLLITIYAITIVCWQTRQKRTIDLHPFDLSTSTCLKGLLAIGIVLAHLQIFCLKPHNYPIVNQFAVLAEVGVFFFISGYGLCYAYQKKGEDYLNGFLSKRLLRIMVPLVIATTGYLSAYNSWSSELLGGAIHGNTPLPYSWFCYVILLYYLWFYVSARLCRDIRLVILSMCVPTLLCYVVMGHVWHWGDWWYRSNIGFNLGMIIKYFETDIRKIFSRYTIPFLSVIPLGLFCIYAGGHFGVDMEVQAIGFSLVILALIYVLGFFLGRCIQWLGKYSYEIYLVHGTLIPLYVCWPVAGILGDVLFALFLFSGTFLLAYLLSQVSSFILKQI